MHDIGFQLSFSATLGLIVLCPRMWRLLRGVPHWIADPAGVTGVVTLATLPVMLSVFHEISLVSPLSHVVAMPLLTPVLLGAAVLAGVSAWPPVAEAVAWRGVGAGSRAVRDGAHHRQSAGRGDHDRAPAAARGAGHGWRVAWAVHLGAARARLRAGRGCRKRSAPDGGRSDRWPSRAPACSA